ncbi:hypothetical protein [Bradyrhizobium liaoningense]|uniref:hypothetical protein n=1 Tax=Bradyrhizobium liaoningense TaxID=43992 RepID=UPI001BA676AA|nr:hypothetical protein [Bradyrhizobium liaoningense]MBR0907356.1 hypothetical protein [Bradyrhizobium liaoningense]
MTLTAIMFAPDNIRTGIDIEAGGTVAASSAAVRQAAEVSSNQSRRDLLAQISSGDAPHWFVDRDQESLDRKHQGGAPSAVLPSCGITSIERAA